MTNFVRRLWKSGVWVRERQVRTGNWHGEATSEDSNKSVDYGGEAHFAGTSGDEDVSHKGQLKSGGGHAAEQTALGRLGEMRITGKACGIVA